MTNAERINQLWACANWNLERGLQLLRWEQHEKNNVAAETMLCDAGRHLRTHDRLRREILGLTYKH